jgi:hypothetical protein
MGVYGCSAVINKSQITSLYYQNQREGVEYPGMRPEVTPNVVQHIDTSGAGVVTIIHSQLNEANSGDTIREQVKYFESIGQDFEWKVYDYDRPPDLKESLGSYGFIVEEGEARGNRLSQGLDLATLVA